MKNIFHWLAAGFVTASLLVSAQAAPGDGDGDHTRMEPPFFGEPGSGHLLGPWSRSHQFAFRHHDDGRFSARGFGRDDRLLRRHRFVTDFRFFQLPTLMIGIRTTTTDTPTIILIMTTARILVTGIRAISPCWCKVNLPGVVTTTDPIMA
jgi:hypothetical protein